MPADRPKRSPRDWSWKFRDTASLILGIPACALILFQQGSAGVAYGAAAVLIVVTPLAARTRQGALLAILWCGGALVFKVPWMAAGAYLALLVVRFGVLLFGSRA